MCEGLAVAHVHGIFHRDIKPGNIFVQADGSLKVLDFGVARLADSNMTASGFIVGTPDFMSPEQARGAEIDHRSDIFSTGAVFYYMLSGRKPFAAPDLPAVLHKVEAEDPLPLAEREAPAGLWKIISKALAKSVTRRYQELGELLTDLTHFQRDYDRQSREKAVAVRARVLDLQRALQQRAQNGRGPTDEDLFSLALARAISGARGQGRRRPRHRPVPPPGRSRDRRGGRAASSGARGRPADGRWASGAGVRRVSRTLLIDDGRIQRELILVGDDARRVAIPNARSATRIRGCRGGTPSSASRPTACGCAISAAATART